MSKLTKEQLAEVLRLHGMWVVNESGGERAYLEEANLEGAYLKGANLCDAIIIFANLSGANLNEANLSRANLHMSDLIRTDLIRADLSKTYLRRATLALANLTGAYLAEADLTEADLEEADLYGANLEDVDLTDASMARAKLRRANLKRTKLIRADLTDASLYRADLEGANLSGANLTRADLEEANLSGANLIGAHLEGANLTGTHFEGANLAGTILEQKKSESKIAYGRARRGVKALAKVTEPMKIAAFKRTFPDAFETVKHDIGGGTLTPEAARELIDRYGMTWQITTSKWTSELQRYSPDPNDVLQLNIDPALVTDEAEVLNTIEAIRDVSYRSKHPVNRLGSFTVGWVRYSTLESILLVEEVQSDLPIVRKGLSDDEFQRELKAKGLTDEKIHAALDVLQPFADRFYHDALALVFDIAEKAGLRVEMLSYEQKQQFGSPRSLYEDLPKSMGMRKAESKIPFIEGKTWQISPNPIRRRGRVVIPKVWRRQG